MRCNMTLGVLVFATALVGARYAVAGQAPAAASAPDIPVSHHDRVYAAEQFSNTVSVIDPASNTLLGVIRLGDPSPANFSPLYRGQLLVHGMGFSPDHRTIAVVSIGSNSVAFIDTATNAVKHITYVGRSPHEAFFTPDGKEVWVTVRGENYVDVLDGHTYQEKTRIITPAGPGMQIFSPDGKYGYVCSSFNPEIDVISVSTHRIVAKVLQASPFCPNIAATPDGTQVWFTLKDTGRTQVFDARPPFALLKTLDTGPITNHVNIVRNAHGQFAYVTVGGLNEVQVFRTDDFSKVATIPVGKLPHGVWPSGDGTRVYVGLENADEMTAIDTLTNRVTANVPIGQAPQAVTYVPDAVPEGPGTSGLMPLGVAGSAAQFSMAAPGHAAPGAQAPTSVTLFDQGLTQVLEASVTGLAPKHPYVSRSVEPGRRWRHAGTTRQLHDQPSRLCNCQCDRTDPSDRAGRCKHASSLPGHRTGHVIGARQARAGAGLVIEPSLLLAPPQCIAASV
jgi:YVTN family beta-propeller protein